MPFTKEYFKTEEGKKMLAEEHRKKISLTLKGHPVLEVTKRKISEKMKEMWMLGKIKDMSGINNPMYGKTHSDESKRKMSIANVGRKPTEKWKKKVRESWTPEKRKAWGEKMKKAWTPERRKSVSEKMKKFWTPERKRVLSEKVSGVNHPFYGRKHTEEAVKRFRNKTGLGGEGNPNWKGGITSLQVRIRQSKKDEEWRKSVFERDDYTCLDCGQKGGYLEAHHKFSFSEILQMFLKEYDQFSPIEDKETLVRLAMKYKPFWDIDNGKTLCIDCHRKKKIEIEIERRY